MKYLLLLTLLTVALPLHAEGTEKVHDEEAHLLQSKSHSKKQLVRTAVVGTLLATAGITGFTGSIGTIATSFHDPSTKIGFPYNTTLPEDIGNCTYFYGNPCIRATDENSVEVINANLCCEGASNQIECEEWCTKSGKKKECIIIEECKGEQTIDPQMGWGIASFVGQIAAWMISSRYVFR